MNYFINTSDDNNDDDDDDGDDDRRRDRATQLKRNQLMNIVCH